MTLQVAIASVAEVGASATQASPSQTNMAPPAMNLVFWATGVCSLAVTVSAANAGADARVKTAAHAAARVMSFMVKRAFQHSGSDRRPAQGAGPARCV